LTSSAKRQLRIHWAVVWPVNCETDDEFENVHIHATHKRIGVKPFAEKQQLYDGAPRCRKQVVTPARAIAPLEHGKALSPSAHNQRRTATHQLQHICAMRLPKLVNRSRPGGSLVHQAHWRRKGQLPRHIFRRASPRARRWVRIPVLATLEHGVAQVNLPVHVSRIQVITRMHICHCHPVAKQGVVAGLLMVEAQHRHFGKRLTQMPDQLQRHCVGVDRHHQLVVLL
jgi:hypothetical protein